MSRKEAPRVGRLNAVVAGRIRTREVAEALRVSERQVRRLRLGLRWVQLPPGPRRSWAGLRVELRDCSTGASSCSTTSGSSPRSAVPARALSSGPAPSHAARAGRDGPYTPRRRPCRRRGPPPRSPPVAPGRARPIPGAPASPRTAAPCSARGGSGHFHGTVNPDTFTGQRQTETLRRPGPFCVSVGRSLIAIRIAIRRGRCQSRKEQSPRARTSSADAARHPFMPALMPAPARFHVLPHTSTDYGAAGSKNYRANTAT